jgi:hypothetical protein
VAISPADAKAEDLGWRSNHLENVDSYPHRISLLVLLHDGRLYSEGCDLTNDDGVGYDDLKVLGEKWLAGLS